MVPLFTAGSPGSGGPWHRRTPRHHRGRIDCRVSALPTQPSATHPARPSLRTSGFGRGGHHPPGGDFWCYCSNNNILRLFHVSATVTPAGSRKVAGAGPPDREPDTATAREDAVAVPRRTRSRGGHSLSAPPRRSSCPALSSAARRISRASSAAWLSAANPTAAATACTFRRGPVRDPCRGRVPVAVRSSCPSSYEAEVGRGGASVYGGFANRRARIRARGLPPMGRGGIMADDGDAGGRLSNAAAGRVSAAVRNQRRWPGPIAGDMDPAQGTTPAGLPEPCAMQGIRNPATSTTLVTPRGGC